MMEICAKKVEKKVPSILDMNYDCLGQIVQFLEMSKEVFSLCKVVKGFYDYIVNVCPSCCSNVLFCMAKKKYKKKNKKYFHVKELSTILIFPTCQVSYVTILVCKIPFSSKKSERMFNKTMEGFPFLRSLRNTREDLFTSIDEYIEGEESEDKPIKPRRSKKEGNKTCVIKTSSRYLKKLILEVGISVSIIIPCLEELYLEFSSNGRSSHFSGPSHLLKSIETDDSGLKILSLKKVVLNDKFEEILKTFPSVENLLLICPQKPETSQRKRNSVDIFGGIDFVNMANPQKPVTSQGKENPFSGFDNCDLGLPKEEKEEKHKEREDNEKTFPAKMIMNNIKRFTFCEHHLEYIDGGELKNVKRSGYIGGTSSYSPTNFELPNLEFLRVFEFLPERFVRYPFLGNNLKELDLKFGNIMNDSMRPKKVNKIVKKILESSRLLTSVKLAYGRVRNCKYIFSDMMYLERIEINKDLINRSGYFDTLYEFQKGYDLLDEGLKGFLTIKNCPCLVSIHSELLNVLDIEKTPKLSSLEILHSDLGIKFDTHPKMKTLNLQLVDLGDGYKGKTKKVCDSLLLSSFNSLEHLSIKDCYGLFEYVYAVGNNKGCNSFDSFPNLRTLMINVPRIYTSRGSVVIGEEEKEEKTIMVTGLKHLSKLIVHTEIQLIVRDLPNLYELIISPPKKKSKYLISNNPRLKFITIQASRRKKKTDFSSDFSYSSISSSPLDNDSLKNIVFKDLHSLESLKFFEVSVGEEGRKENKNVELDVYRIEKLNSRKFCQTIRNDAENNNQEFSFGVGKLKEGLVFSI